MNTWRRTVLSEEEEKLHQMRTQSMCDPTDLSQAIRNILSNRCPKAVPTDGGTVRRHAAILVPLLCPPQAEDWAVLFTRRSDKVALHKGQISFPGGAIEAHDLSPLQAMLRESEEEIGLKPEALDILGSLDEAATLASNFIIHPFVGIIPSGYPFEINPFEVEKILTFPLRVFRSLEGEPCVGEVLYQGKRYRGPVFAFGGEVIWGATARVMENFMAVVGSKLPLPVEPK